MGKIILSKLADYKINTLAETLYIKHYFGYQADADGYVQRIRDFIEPIPNQPHKECYNPKFGKYYARFDNPKSDMQYYITFNKLGDRYLIKDIISPKTKAYKQIKN